MPAGHAQESPSGFLAHPRGLEGHALAVLLPGEGLCDDAGMSEVPDPLPLRSIDVPLEVSAVAGCDCGGIQWHRSSSWSDPDGCSIWQLPPDERQANMDDAEARLGAFTDALNAKLRAALRA
jgi:hypothetical protein